MVEQRQTAVNRMPGPARPTPAAPVAALTPKEIFGILRRHVLLIFSLTILGFMVGGGAWYLLLNYAPKYTARTYLKVLAPVEKDPMTIGAAMVAKDILYGYRASIAALIMQQSTLEELIERPAIQKTKWFRRFGNIEYERHKCIRKAFKDLRKHFGASPERDREFVALSMVCGNAKEAALIVNQMVDLFLNSQGITRKREIGNKLTELEKQRDRVQRDLTLAENTLTNIRTVGQLGFTDLETRQYRDTSTLKLDNLELQQNNLLLEIEQARADVNNLQQQAVGPVTVQVENIVETDPIMVALAQQLAFQEAELRGRLTKFGGNHRVVRQTQDLIDEIRKRREIRKAEIAEQTRQARVRNAQDRLIVLASRYEQLEALRNQALARKEDLDRARAEYERQVTIKDERKQMLDAIIAQIENWRIVYDDPETPRVQSVGRARVPLTVSSPLLYLYVPGGTMLGFMFGVGLTFLIELLNDLVRTPRDVSRYLRIPLLGVIPNAAEDRQAHGVDLCHVVRQAPYCFISESYRRLRTNLKLSGAAESLKVLLVSSGIGGEGKTSVAINLATAFVAENKRVLLIGANFRRPRLHTVFAKPGADGSEGEPSGCGLSTLLTGQCGYQEATRPSGVEGFDVIDSGQLPSNPAELLDSPRMEELIKHQRQSYDYVIVDGPPVLLVSDTKVLARLVDATILVFNAGTTRRGAAQRAIRELREVNATIVGCVLFAVKALKGGYFTEQFRSYEEYQELQLAHSV